MSDDANRRPLKSRSTGWAARASRAALASGLSPNAISFLGIVVAALGALAIVAGRDEPLWWIVGAAAIQLRLLANMLDGMVALEGGRGGPTGAIWNEVPDRVEDSMFLVAAGYASGLPWLGWLAALLAAVCAYVRLLGGSLGHAQDFCGPGAKPHRMAILTLSLIVGILWFGALQLGLALIAVLTAITIARRLARLSKRLRA